MSGNGLPIGTPPIITLILIKKTLPVPTQANIVWPGEAAGFAAPTIAVPIPAITGVPARQVILLRM